MSKLPYLEEVFLGLGLLEDVVREAVHELGYGLEDQVVGGLDFGLPAVEVALVLVLGLT